jgi:hypothetical protein
MRQKVYRENYDMVCFWLPKRRENVFSSFVNVTSFVYAVAQASTFRPSNVAPIILTNSVWYVRKTQKYIFFNVEETMKSVPFSLKKIGGILNQMEYYLKMIESENSVESISM